MIASTFHDLIVSFVDFGFPVIFSGSPLPGTRQARRPVVCIVLPFTNSYGNRFARSRVRIPHSLLLLVTRRGSSHSFANFPAFLRS